MKTLNEVIEWMEKIVLPMTFEAVKEDALHYLKAFRDAKDTLEMEKDRYAEAVANCNAVETKYMLMAKDALRNEPLTWEELKQMEGKPVWVEGTSLKSAWYLILDFDVDNDMMLCVGQYYERIPLHCDRLGIYWQAYRKERE